MKTKLIATITILATVLTTFGEEPPDWSAVATNTGYQNFVKSSSATNTVLPCSGCGMAQPCPTNMNRSWTMSFGITADGSQYFSNLWAETTTPYSIPDPTLRWAAPVCPSFPACYPPDGDAYYAKVAASLRSAGWLDDPSQILWTFIDHDIYDSFPSGALTADELEDYFYNTFWNVTTNSAYYANHSIGATVTQSYDGYTGNYTITIDTECDVNGANICDCGSYSSESHWIIKSTTAAGWCTSNAIPSWLCGESLLITHDLAMTKYPLTNCQVFNDDGRLSWFWTNSYYKRPQGDVKWSSTYPNNALTNFCFTPFSLEKKCMSGPETKGFSIEPFINPQPPFQGRLHPSVTYNAYHAGWIGAPMCDNWFCSMFPGWCALHQSIRGENKSPLAPAEQFNITNLTELVTYSEDAIGGTLQHSCSSSNSSPVFTNGTWGWLKIEMPAYRLKLISHPFNIPSRDLDWVFSDLTPESTTSNRVIRGKLPHLACVFFYNYSNSYWYPRVFNAVSNLWDVAGADEVELGAGVMLANPSAENYTLVLHGFMYEGLYTNTIPTNWSVCSSMNGMPGTLDELGFPSDTNTIVALWDSNSGWVEYQRTNVTVTPPTPPGEIKDWTPSCPVIGMGEAFMVYQATQKEWRQYWKPFDWYTSYTNGLWLEITNAPATNILGVAHNCATNITHLVQSHTNLITTNWITETSFLATNVNQGIPVVYRSGRDPLFLRLSRTNAP